MVDENFELRSAASSGISDSVCEQILGKKCHPRPPPRTSLNNNQGSYHTAEGSFVVLSKKSESFQIIPSPKQSPFEIVEMVPSSEGQRSRQISTSPSLRSDGPKYQTIETQTVAIQTMETGVDPPFTDCRCTHCQCPECNPLISCSKREEKASSVEEPESETSSQTINVKSRYQNRMCDCSCNYKERWFNDSTSQLSDADSDASYSTDFYDLPYQNNEDYLKLIRELEKKLVARNRERVRRTMQEFEKRSRQNQNLDKPIFDYSGDDGSLLARLPKFQKTFRREESVCCKCGKHKRINSDILQNEKKWEKIRFGRKGESPTATQVERSLHKSHWQMDPRSGEWVKVTCFQQTDYATRPPKHGDFVDEEFVGPLPPLPPPPCKKECCCRKKRR